jgi:hypothetical protein
MRHGVWALCIASWVPVALAGDFSSEPYLLRLGLALTRASNYAQTAGRQASIAYPGGSSVNPAGMAATPITRPDATATTIQAFGDSGAHIGAYAATTALPLDDTSVASFAFAYTDTYDGETQDGLDNLLRSDEVFVGFAKRLAPSTPFGVQIRLVDSTINDEGIRRDGLSVPTRLEAELRSLDASAGIQTAFSDTVRMGAAAGFGYGEASSRLTNLQPLYLPFGGPPIPVGTELGRFNDRVRSYVAGIGAAYLPQPWTALLADLTYLAIDGGPSGRASLGRLAFGGQTRVANAWTARAGWSYDTVNEQTWSVGLGTRLVHRLSLDVAYQYNNTPEVKPELGTVQLVSVSVALEL